MPPMLHLAACLGLRCLQVLLRHGTDPRAHDNPAEPYDGWLDALIYAAGVGGPRVLRVLLASDLYARAGKPYVDFVLFKAVWCGQADSVAQLLAAGRDAVSPLYQGFSALQLAKHRALLQLIVTGLGDDPPPKPDVMRQIAQMLVKAGATDPDLGSSSGGASGAAGRSGSSAAAASGTGGTKAGKQAGGKAGNFGRQGKAPAAAAAGQVAPA